MLGAGRSDCEHLGEALAKATASWIGLLWAVLSLSEMRSSGWLRFPSQCLFSGRCFAIFEDCAVILRVLTLWLCLFEDRAEQAPNKSPLSAVACISPLSGLRGPGLCEDTVVKEVSPDTCYVSGFSSVGSTCPLSLPIQGSGAVRGLGNKLYKKTKLGMFTAM